MIGPSLRRRRLGTASLAIITAAFVFVGCGGQTRSPEAFCSALHSEKQRILAEFNATSHAGSNDQLARLLLGLGASLQALGELRTYFHKLADVAPDEIKDDAQIVANDWDRQVSSASDM